MKRLGEISYLSLLVLAAVFGPPAEARRPDPCPTAMQRVSSSPSRKEIVEAIGPRLQAIAYPDIPSVESLSLVPSSPQRIRYDDLTLSDGLIDPFLERVRRQEAVDDFKVLSDLKRKTLTALERKEILAEARTWSESRPDAQREAAFLKYFLDRAYEPTEGLKPAPGLASPKWAVNSGNPKIDAAFSFVENSWSKLARRSPERKLGSLLPSPFPVLIAAPGRFHESYYWDTYFMAKALLATGRLELAQMQAENFLEAIRTYGFIPNGMRDYYLTRSQPPFVSSLVKEVVEASLAEAKTTAARERVITWVRERALPLLQKDYHDFWMNPHTRFHAPTGLNHHWDALNQPRQEKHRFDDELAIGTTYRDTRAGAESGRDFTETFGKDYASTAGVLLNSLLFKTERDLAWLARLIGVTRIEQTYFALSARRKNAMLKHLWNDRVGQFENYGLLSEKRIPLLSADGIAAPLFAELFDRTSRPDREKVKRLVRRLAIIEDKGGIVASEVWDSHHQWDRGPDNNAWAPDQVMTIQGLAHYGFETDAKRIAAKWVETVALIHDRYGTLYERIDAGRRDRPRSDESKYPVQGGKDSLLEGEVPAGFGWSNGGFQWSVIFLGHTPVASAHRPGRK